MSRTHTPRSRPSPKRCTCELTVAERHRGRDRHAAVFICRRAVHTSHSSAGSSRVGPRHGRGCRGARVGPAMRAAGGMRVNRGRPGAWPSSVSSVPLQDPPVRGALEEGEAQAGGRPEVDRARGLKRPRRGGEQQDQGGDQAGIRVQEHRQPDSARHAQVLRPQARATRQGGGVTPTHTNSRSLRF